jgi:hypothetical protein
MCSSAGSFMAPTAAEIWSYWAAFVATTLKYIMRPPATDRRGQAPLARSWYAQPRLAGENLNCRL